LGGGYNIKALTFPVSSFLWQRPPAKNKNKNKKNLESALHLRSNSSHNVYERHSQNEKKKSSECSL
jgi:hypothetical protein